MVSADPQVVVRRSARRTRTVTAYRERDTIVVLLPQHVSTADEKIFVADLVKKVLAREAKTDSPGDDTALRLRAAELSEQFLEPVLGRSCTPASVAWVTNQNRRWGSCTPANRAIRLSHRLRRMPGWVVDYVLLHELAHLVEPAHSARFWSLVSVYPQAERAKGFLEGYQVGAGQPPARLDDA